jgi:radical SAM superfamily enzyme YgiQ (UPF0313 family)
MEAGRYHAIILQDGGYMPARGGYQIAHNLRKHGYRVKVISFLYWLTQDDLAKMVDRFVDRNMDIVVGISSTFLQTHESRNKARFFIDRIKSIARKVVVVKGGTYYYDYIDSDYNLRGQYTEDQAVQLFNKLYGRISFRPFEIEKLDFKHNSDDVLPYGSVLPIEVSRHCRFKCSFCSYANRGIKGIDRDFSLFRDELIDSNQRYGTKDYMLMCSTFNDRKEKIRNFLDSLKGLSYTPKFGMFVRLDLLMKQKEFWPEMKEVASGMLFGVESFNVKSLKSIGKTPHPEKIKDWLLEIREYFTETITYSGFIIGLPFDDPDEHEKTQEWLEKNKALDGYDFRPLYVASPDAPTEELSDFDVAIDKYGYVKHENIKDQHYKKWSRPDGFTFDKANEIADRLNARRDSTLLVISSVWLRQFDIDPKSLKVENNINAFNRHIDSVVVENMNRYIREYVRLELEQ